MLFATIYLGLSWVNITLQLTSDTSSLLKRTLTSSNIHRKLTLLLQRMVNGTANNGDHEDGKENKDDD